MEDPVYYRLRPDYSVTWAEVWEDDIRFDPRCPACDRTIANRPGGRLLPLGVKIMKPRNMGDFFWLAPELLVNERAKHVLAEHAPRCVTFVEAVVTNTDSIRLWSVEVSCRCSTHKDLDIQAGFVCPVCGDIRYTTWNGGIRIAECSHEMFRLIEFRGWIWVTDALMRAITLAGLRNVTFQDARTVVDEFPQFRPPKRT
jgi:hypothetical protein